MKELITLLLLVIISSCTTSTVTDTPDVEDGLHLVFLLGEDKAGHAYYSLADEYYAGLPAVDHLVRHIRSLSGVIDYLNGLQGQAIHTVDIVVHGNKNTGLTTDITEGGYRATPKRLLQEAILHRSARLAPDVVDSFTVVHVWSCGVGSNRIMRLGVRQLFRPSSGPAPRIEISEDFVVYKRSKEGQVQRYAATYYPYQYRRGYRPSESEILHDLRSRYPDSTVDWEAAMRDPSQHIEYHLPVTFLQYYDNPRNRPDLSTAEQRLGYVRAQSEITDQLTELDMTYDDFHWQVDKRIVTDNTGRKRYAVKAIGMTTILCYLEIGE